MNGHFEVGNSSYPIGYLEYGDLYRVTDMRTLEPLHNTGLPKHVASRIASDTNNQFRTNGLIGSAKIVQHIQQEVAAYMKDNG